MGRRLVMEDDDKHGQVGWPQPPTPATPVCPTCKGDGFIITRSSGYGADYDQPCPTCKAPAAPPAEQPDMATGLARFVNGLRLEAPLTGEWKNAAADLLIQLDNAYRASREECEVMARNAVTVAQLQDDLAKMDAASIE